MALFMRVIYNEQIDNVTFNEYLKVTSHLFSFAISRFAVHNDAVLSHNDYFYEFPIEFLKLYFEKKKCLTHLIDLIVKIKDH